MKFTLRLLGCLVVVLAVACGKEAPPDDDRDGHGGDDSGAVESLKKVIGPDGGSISIDAASLDFPPGALSSNEEISISLLSEADVAPLPAGASFASPPVAFEPHGLSFDAPVAVNLSFDGGVGKRFVVAKLDSDEDETWEKGADADFKDGKATFTISGFSIWAVVEDPDGAFDDSGSGGTGGGTGGTGGTGGSGGSGGPTGPGAFETTGLSGIVTLENESDTITSHNVDTATGLPYCVAGLAPANLEGDGLVGLKFDLGETGTSDVDFTPSGDGLFFALDTATDAELEVTLHTTLGGVYCEKDHFMAGRNFVAWDDFSVDCDEEGITPVYDPETEVIDAITMLAVPFTEGNGREFDFCVNDFDESYYGYFETADFHGYVSTYQSGLVTIAQGVEGTNVLAGACVSGANTDTGSFGLSMNLAQSVEGTIGDYTLESEGLELSFYAYDQSGSGDLWAYIGDGNTEWCAALPYNAGHWNSPYFIPWTSFTSSCGSGTPFGGGDLKTLRITREGAATNYDLCLYDAIDTAESEVGLFLSGAGWHGYPEVSVPTAEVTLETNLSWERGTANACMRGKVNALATGSATLLVPLSQATPASAPEAVTVTPGAELQYRIDLYESLTDDAVAVVVGGDNVEYCAAIASSYEQSIPWAAFQVCGAGGQFPETSVKSVGVRINSDSAAETPFDLCIYTLGEVAAVPQ